MQPQIKGYLDDLQISSLSGMVETGSMLKARGRINGIVGVDSALFTVEILDSYWVQEDLKSFLEDTIMDRFALLAVSGNKVKR